MNTTISSPPTVKKVDNISRSKVILEAALGPQRPWTQMLNFHGFNRPISHLDAISRIKSNLDYFRMNHFVLVYMIFLINFSYNSLVNYNYCYARANSFGFPIHLLSFMFVLLYINPVVSIPLASLIFVFLWWAGTWGCLSSGPMFGVMVVLLHSVFRKTDDLNLDEVKPGFLINDATKVSVSPPRVNA